MHLGQGFVWTLDVPTAPSFPVEVVLPLIAR